MKQSTRNVFGKQKNILELAGELFQNINIKVNKSDATLKDGILEAGTIVDKVGKKSTDVNAFGIVYNDVDFNNSHGTEVVPVTIFGFIKESALPEKPTAEVKTVLKMIQFL
ncbi:hypothetical protein HYH37_00395 [Clostridium botulinum]|uniref:hypothetical protein n=1 Tax=Clostridium botulinum TaxID=1491 RepID=UPI001C9AA606|nr:hypothetical protein [Clostridium botulinum]MBY6871671.1 hypothetical protein [Clostridium botulinum]HBJ2602290.1 hypothetical protein [Clostridium botulinum]